ncbi:hypothetical protein BpHYR1_054101 [Brachionus plicatilis]|uniref:Uncharacterized protein n=1 Tax=Brachionus plicatilis TaxID=10195 RepID=A0A3M7QE36_BRAPC|nr:hypothetical protein BpHYR1_054101 [Brachionus plicatilis]
MAFSTNTTRIQLTTVDTIKVNFTNYAAALKSKRLAVEFFVAKSTILYGLIDLVLIIWFKENELLKNSGVKLKKIKIKGLEFHLKKERNYMKRRKKN